MWANYPLLSGTVFGETQNEIYNRYGLSALENTRYECHAEHINETTVKIYNLVITEPTQYLTVTVNFKLKFDPLASHTNKDYKGTIDINTPETIHLEWVSVSACNIPYTP